MCSLPRSTRRPPPRRATRALTALLAALLALPPASPVLAQNQLPALGDSVGEDFGVGTERKLGEQIMRDIRRDPDYIDDPVLVAYIQSLWQPLLANARQRGEIGLELDDRFAWEAFLVRDRSVNAFALPGGFVGVHLGLIGMTATPDELASVLAHELSHVTQRHIARSITNSKRASLLGAAAMILGVLAASRSSRGDAANAVISGGQAAAIQGQLNFSRDMEREADRIGFSVMTGAGFAPGGMAAMFEKLDQSSRLNDSGGFPYLRSHPLTSERIGEARARMGVAERPAPVGVLEHTLAQARARVLMDPRIDALRRWQAQDSNLASTDKAAALAAAYSSALASTQLRDWPRADAALRRAEATLAELNSNAPDRSKAAAASRALDMLVAQSLLERGQPALAEQRLTPYLVAMDGMAGTVASRPLLLLSAQVALAAAQAAGGTMGQPLPEPQGGQLRKRADALQTWLASYPQDATTWQLVSQLWGRLNQPLRAVRAEAEARFALGDLNGAADRLRAGQRLSRSSGNDFIEASVIDARLRDVEVLRKQEEAELREQRGG